MTTADRRSSPRYRALPGTFAYFHSFGSRTVGAIRDLSVGGVYIEDPRSRFTEESELDLELPLEDEVLVLRGVVARSFPGQGFAVQFRAGPPDKEERLEEFLHQLSSKEAHRKEPAAAEAAPAPAGREPLTPSNALELAALVELLEEKGILTSSDLLERMKEILDRKKPH